MLPNNTLDYIRGFSRGYTACQRHGRQTVIIHLTSGGLGRCLVPRGVDLEIYVDGELWTHVAPAPHRPKDQRPCATWASGGRGAT